MTFPLQFPRSKYLFSQPITDMQSEQPKLLEDVISLHHSLQNINEKIERLEAELSKARQERERLENDIAKHRASATPIDRVPSEILTLIFEKYVKHQPTNVRRLLQVCRLWYRLAIDTPSLWTYIHIRANLSDPMSYTSNLRYVQVCCKRSKSALLHIDMDFRCFPTHYEYVDNRLYPILWELTEGTQHWSDAIPGFKSLAYERIVTKYVRMVNLIASHMKRWQTLRIVFGYDSEVGEIFQAVWPLLRGRTPKLTELAVKGVSLSRLQDKPEYATVFSKSPLNNLTITDHRIFASIASYNPALETLVCDLESLESFKYIYAFKGLRRLTLIYEADNYHFNVDDFHPSKLYLPSLQYLSLQGSVPGKIIECLEAPALQNLHIRREPYDDLEGLPSVLPIHIAWEVEPWSSSNTTSSTAELQTLFKKYPGVQTFETYRCNMEDALALLGSIREKDQGLTCLKYMAFTENPTDRRRRELSGEPAEVEMVKIDTRIEVIREYYSVQGSKEEEVYESSSDSDLYIPWE